MVHGSFLFGLWRWACRGYPCFQAPPLALRLTVQQCHKVRRFFNPIQSSSTSGSSSKIVVPTTWASSMRKDTTQTLHGTAIFADQLGWLKRGQLIGSPMPVPDRSRLGRTKIQETTMTEVFRTFPDERVTELVRPFFLSTGLPPRRSVHSPTGTSKP